MTTRLILSSEKAKIQDNQVVYLPARFLDFLNFDRENGELTMQCAIGKNGPFFYVFNEKQQKIWCKERTIKKSG